MTIFMTLTRLLGLSCCLRDIKRLLTLLLVLVVGGRAVFPVHGASINKSSHFKFDFTEVMYPGGNHSTQYNTDDQFGFTTEIRREKLYNMCSKHLVRILRKGKKGVDAKGQKNRKLSTLVFKNTGQRTIQIFGAHTGFYICFNRRGKLITRKNPKRKLCQFIEREDGGYIKYQTADPRFKWFMGFKKNGKPLKGHSIKNPQCYKFLKVDQKYLCKKRGENGIKHCSLVKTVMRPDIPSTIRHRHGKHWREEESKG